jgi:ribosome recycling factor
MEELNKAMSDAKNLMDKAVDHLNHELEKVRTGRASADLLKDIMVEYYGSPVPLSQVANLQVSDARTMVVQPWERNMLGPIERALINANLGMTPGNDGETIRLSVPPLTEERRKEMCKKAKGCGEDAKVAVRNVRHKVLEVIKKSVKDGTPEDIGKRKETDLQDLVNKYAETIDKLAAAKEKAIMTV